MQQVALDFTAYLKSIQITLNGNQMKFRGKRVGRLGITENDWYLHLFAQHDEYLNELISRESEEIKSFVEGQTGYGGCGRCITGKCACTGIEMINPDESLCEFAKKLIILRCDALINERVPKCNYVKISDRGTMKKCAKCKICNPACRALKNY